MLLFLIAPLVLLAQGTLAHRRTGLPVQYSRVIREPDFICTEPNGYEKVAGKCDVYFECQNSKPVQHSCPDGLYFNAKARWPDFPCSYPSEVKCAEGDEIQVALRSAGCDHRYGYYRLNNDDCRSFTVCREGLATVFKCPLGLVFNAKKDICDWPFNVPECSHIAAFENYTCSANYDVKYRYQNSCKHFVACINGSPMLLKCDDERRFDEKDQTCKSPELVSDTDCDPREDEYYSNHNSL